MTKNGKVSKVALCPRCNNFILACHINYLDKKTEKEFTKFTNDGFTVKIETIEETRARDLAFYQDCISEKCIKTN